MAEITREHLELAALAAGHEIVCTEAEHACCGALENGPHKMGCDYKLVAIK